MLLRRHQLVRLNAAGWSAIQARAWDADARACLLHWAAHGLPLVVTQQPTALPQDHIALGLPAPLQWARRRLPLQVPLHSVLDFDEFPAAAAIAGLLPRETRAQWMKLLDTVANTGAQPYAYGGFGWEWLTGLKYLHSGSDLDLWFTVDAAAMADEVAEILYASAFAGPRLDGECVFPDGSAVAWREWRQWRAGLVDRILVKRLRGVTMEAEGAWLGAYLPCC